MLSSVLSLGVIALMPMVAGQASYIYAGCLAQFTSGTAAPAGAASIDACNSACSATKYFYYRAAATNPCQCSSDDPYQYTLQQAPVATSQSSGGTCPTNSIQVYMRDTTFRFGGCYTGQASSSTNGDLLIVQAVSLASIAQTCRGQRTVVITLDYGSRTYNGYCGSGQRNPSPFNRKLRRRYRTEILYTALAAASQLARRNARLARRVIKGPNYCPAGLTACNVEGVSDSYECLDIRSELESCGGCIHGTYGSNNATLSGQDCTTMKGARPRSVTSTRGRCVAMSCIKGYIPAGGECVASR